MKRKKLFILKFNGKEECEYFSTIKGIFDTYGNEAMGCSIYDIYNLRIPETGKSIQTDKATITAATLNYGLR